MRGAYGSATDGTDKRGKFYTLNLYAIFAYFFAGFNKRLPESCLKFFLQVV